MATMFLPGLGAVSLLILVTLPVGRVSPGPDSSLPAVPLATGQAMSSGVADAETGRAGPRSHTVESGPQTHGRLTRVPELSPGLQGLARSCRIGAWGELRDCSPHSPGALPGCEEGEGLWASPRGRTSRPRPGPCAGPQGSAETGPWASGLPRAQRGHQPGQACRGLWPLRVMGPLCPPRAPSRRGWPPSPARKAVGVATQVIPAAESASARTRSHGNVWAVLPVKFSAAGHLGGPSCTAHFTRQAGEGWGGPLVGRPLLGVSLLRAGPALQPLSHARCKQRPGVCLSRGVPGCPLGRPGSAPSPMGVHPAGGREDISVSGSTNRK